MKKRILSSILALALLTALAPFALANSFTDVSSDAWYYNDVMYAVETGLVNGKSATTYEPESMLTGAEAVKLAATMHQLNTTGSITLTAGDPWYQPYADYASENGVTTGIHVNRDWNQPITRGEYMDWFSRAIPSLEDEAINEIKDTELPDVGFYNEYSYGILVLYNAGVVQGSGDERLALPNDTIKRSEVATIIARMMDPSRRVEFTMTDKLGVIIDPLEITRQPEDGYIGKDQAHYLSLYVVGGVEPYTFEWQMLKNSEWETVVDGEHFLYSDTNALLARILPVDHTFRCIITDAQGTSVTTDMATLTVGENYTR